LKTFFFQLFITYLILTNADIHKIRPDTGASPLSIATEMGHIDVVQFCIDNKADVNEHR